MPAFSPNDQAAQAAAWQSYVQTLGSYQAARSLDANYDPAGDMGGYIQAAASTLALYQANAMNASFNDAAKAIRSLQNIITKSNQHVANLTAQVNSWNRFASLAGAVAGLATSIATLNPVGILTAADAAAVAYSGNPNS